MNSIDNKRKAFVSLKDISKIYPNGVQAVYDFNIDINEVELFEEKFINSLLSIENTKIDPTKFNILKKKYYASIIKGLNEYYLLKEMAEAYLKTGVKPLKYIQLIKDVKIKDLNNSKKYIKKENISCNIFLMK